MRYALKNAVKQQSHLSWILMYKYYEVQMSVVFERWPDLLM